MQLSVHMRVLRPMQHWQGWSNAMAAVALAAARAACCPPLSLGVSAREGVEVHSQDADARDQHHAAPEGCHKRLAGVCQLLDQQRQLVGRLQGRGGSSVRCSSGSGCGPHGALPPCQRLACGAHACAGISAHMQAPHAGGVINVHHLCMLLWL